jgi:hypothetical protein
MKLACLDDFVILLTLKGQIISEIEERKARIFTKTTVEKTVKKLFKSG